MLSLRAKSAIVSICFLAVFLGAWEATSQPPKAEKALTEYELLMGGADQEARVPPPLCRNHALDCRAV